MHTSYTGQTNRNSSPETHNQANSTRSSIVLKLSSVALAMMAFNPAIVNAEETQSIDDVDTVVVTATRTEKSLADIPATVSVIDADQIEREISNNISDLVRYEPGVSVAGGGRFGLSGFTIRGIGGDRVLTLVDGTPTADEFSFGPFLSSRRNFVDLDALKSVEIVRGPSSSAFGSNALGGVVNFVTKNPTDYLDEKAFAGSAKLTYSSIDQSTNATVLSAFGNPTLSGMVVVTQRDYSETETFFADDSLGADRRSQNPQDGDNTNVFAKVVFQPTDSQSISLVAESYSGETETDVASAANTVSRGVVTLSQTGIDDRSRERFSINYQLSADTALFDDLSLLAYTQSSDAEQITLAERLSPGVGVQDRTRSSLYEQQNTGLRLQFNKLLEFESSRHQFSYGIDYDNSESETRRDGFTINRASNTPAIEFSNFPTRDFPLSEYKTQGFFVQDDISLLDGRLSIIPSLRYDSFELSPESDPIYEAGNPGAPTPEGFDESQVSTKLGVMYTINESWSIFGQYAEGFRAPSLDAVNVGFTNFAGGYTAIPNPNLKPEKAEGVEFGVRHTSEYLSLNLVAYQNDYLDFIESLATRGFNPITRLLEFQARNLDEAQIEGFEAKLLADLTGVSEALEGFQVRASYAYAKGENLEDNSPINSIDPQQLVLGVGYAATDNRWGLESVLTMVDRKQAADIDASSLQSQGAPQVVPFETPGYGILDLIGYYNVNDNLRLNWGIYNLTDKQHFSWSEEFVQNPASANFDQLTEAGRNYSVSIKYQF